ncbi:MAG TPA: RNA polymerase sigma factor [Blastocatellia bacterium]|nr:RNA polymerase sigma factor [Blastocatellia bacterium]
MEEKQVIDSFLSDRTDEAFCALFEAFCVRLRRYFLLRGLDAATAEDLTQDVFVKVHQRAGELREPDRFHGWLFAIARNEMVSYWRREQPRLEWANVENPVVEPDVISGMRLTDMLRTLEPAERDLVVLRFVEGLSYEELAEALKLPLGTIKWRIFNVRKKLARSLAASPAQRAREIIN